MISSFEFIAGTERIIACFVVRFKVTLILTTPVTGRLSAASFDALAHAVELGVELDAQQHDDRGNIGPEKKV
jgi:hypothetical protein